MSQTQQQTGQDQQAQYGQGQPGQYNQGQQGQYNQGQTGQSQWSPEQNGQFDTEFAQMTQSSGFTGIDWVREHFETVDRTTQLLVEQIRSARRVAELAVQSEIHKDQLVRTAQLVRNQVIADIRRDPSLLRSLQQGS